MDVILLDNNIDWKFRIKELAIDYVVIVVYLALLFIVSIMIYFMYFDGIPIFTELQNQLIAVLTSVIPVIFIFSYLDYKGGSIGKRKSGLYLYFRKKSFICSLLRNTIKFLPWQIAHIGVIHGLYTNFDILSSTLALTSIVLLVIMIYMGFHRKDKRHFGDVLARTQVQVKK